MIRRVVSAAAVASAISASALAAQNVSPAQLQYEAAPLIIASGGINTPPFTDASAANRGAGYDGVVSLQINTPGGTYICTGSLLWTGVDILTAGHCPHAGGGATSIDAIFFPGPFGNSAIQVMSTTRWSVKPGYNPAGGAVQENDLAVIHLPSFAPANVTRYSLFSGNAVGHMFDVVGFGARGSNGAGVQAGPSFTIRRHGFNVFDFNLGDVYGSVYDQILMADFDNGTATNDASCFWFGVCQQGVPGEASVAGGDSGGPAFINGRIAGVTSFGIRFAAPSAGFPGNPPDVDANFNQSFGEHAGWVRADEAWIRSVAAPEPSTYVLMATGLGMIGMMARRRRR